MMKHLLLVVLAIAFAAKLAVVLWGIDRGFEIGDEGVFLLALNDPKVAPPGFEFYRLLELVPGRSHIGVLTARFIRFGVHLAGFGILAVGVWRWWRSSRMGSGGEARLAPLLVFGALGTFLYAGSRGLSYNAMTNLCTYSAVSALLVLLSIDARRSGARAACAVVMGVAAGSEFLVKFPTAILLLVLLSGFVIAYSDGRGARLRLVALLWAAAASTVVVPLSAIYDRHELWQRLEEARLHSVTLGYSIAEILQRYWYFDIASHYNMALLVGSFAVIFVLLRRLVPAAGGDRRDAVLAGSLAIASAALLAGVHAYHPYTVGASLVFLFCFLPFTSIVLALSWWSEVRSAGDASPTRELAVLALLVAVPYVAIAGTDVALTLKLPNHAVPMVLAVAVAAHSLRGRGYHWTFGVVAFVLVGLNWAIVSRNHVYWPYGVPTPLFQQNVPVPRPVGMKVDAATAAFLSDLRAAAASAGMKPRDPVVALDYMPGLVHILDATSPGSPLFSPAAMAFNCEILNRRPFRSLPFLLLGQPITSNQKECLSAWQFPQDFRLVARLPNPYRRVYPYFFSLPDFPFVYLYAPASSATTSQAPQAEQRVAGYDAVGLATCRRVAIRPLAGTAAGSLPVGSAIRWNNPPTRHWPSWSRRTGTTRTGDA